MDQTLTNKRFGFSQRKLFVLFGFLFTCIFLTVLIDFLESKFQNSGFYISESLLFSSYWWIFLPLWYGQLSFLETHKTKVRFALIVLIPIIIHLFAFPGFVWIISFVFYPHTFEFGQTFEFGLTQHFFKIFLLYTIPIGLYAFFRDRIRDFQSQNNSISKEANDFLTSLKVREGNKQLQIPTKDVRYFSANPPYVNVYYKDKKHLCNITLKSLSEKLDRRFFVRIHKSEIANLIHVQSYKSRQNGDYDVTMDDGTLLRLSRNFAKDFKSRLEILTQDKL
ncbi:LytTR family DNA-binding domain-containing protein [Aquiflexum gelatinilyticum]|uniref:LytTR family transcriptional regulator n=1 Tax=Aquiflexum gelatinilyticum TaxID=2961943 RepID=A0A9X2P923_9BACT|nr:LytTR family DNA-binding domain-containing protein [Aquiflexum gelatinilyticum]MCR9016558.1 LytTR family transcriptional regulator [Aquiflexum gelatinilyticum]